MRLLLLICTILTVLFLSCSTHKKAIYNYIYDTTDTLGKGVVKNVELIIQKNDLLSIQVYSNSIKPQISDAMYNPPVLNSTTGGSTTGASTGGYLVDLDGNITFPRIGMVHAEGLTKKQLVELITSKITDLENPTVIIRFLNYRITVLGEVGHQGTFVIPYEKLTIFEAIGLAGDIPVTGSKEKVKIIREVNGDREIGTIDLTSKDVFESPYFNLQQNDVVLVEARKSKIKQVDQAIVIQRITFALSIVTSLALLYGLFK